MSSDNQRMGHFGKAWVVGVVIFSVARALIAWPTLGRFGVNPWVFLAIDLVTAVPYGVGQVKLVIALRERSMKGIQQWSAVVLITFLAPYIYIFIAGGEEMPLWAWIIVTVLMLIFGASSVARLRRNARQPMSVPTAAENDG